MPDNLLRPDNRSISSWTGDFSLYGAQPGISVTVTRERDGDAVFASTPAAMPTAPAPAPAAPSQHGAPPVDDGTQLIPTVPPTMSFIGETAAPTRTADLDPIGSAIAPSFAGSTPPGILVPTVAPPTGPDGSGSADSTAPARVGLDTASDGPADLFGNHNFVAGTRVLALGQGEVAAVGGLVTTAGITLGSGIAGTVQARGGVVEDLASSVRDTSAALSAGPADVLATTSDLVGEVGTAVDMIGSDLAASASTIADDLGTVTGSVTSTVRDVGQEVVSDATTVVDQAGATVNALVQDVAASVPAVDDLPLAGADPIGGVATLVDLVQTSELFVVGQGDLAPSAADAGGSVLDTLIGTDPVIDLAPDDDAAHHLPTDVFDDLHLGL